MNNYVIKRILGYLRPYKAQLAGALLCAAFGIPLGLLCPVLIGNAIDLILGPGQVDFAGIGMNLLLLAAAVALSGLLSWLTNVFTRRISARLTQELRQMAFDKLNQVPLKTIDGHAHGDLVSRLVNDSDALAEGLLQSLSQLIPGFITILSTIFIMLTLNLTIALVVIFVTPLSILFARFIGKRTSKMFRRQSAAQGAVSAYVGEMVGNLRLLQAFNAQHASTQDFEELNQDYFTSNFKATFYSSIINPGTRFVNTMVYAVVGVFGALYAISGHITVGGLSAFLSYANQYTRPFNEVTAVLTQLQNAIAGAERLFAVIDMKPEPPDAPQAAAPAGSQGNVLAEQVYFSYNRKKPLIQDFNLEATNGMRVALVGATGCGKTTIISLLMRFYDIDKGKISVDSRDIYSVKRNTLRGFYGMVLQETWLKNATVHENIAYGRPGATLQQVEAAARATYAHPFIMRLPQGYNTVIGPGGGSLSEGQKQLLCIARIMLAKPDMLILDEATSSIDTRTEVLIQRAFDKLMEGRTSFIVAHRLSTIQNADLILMMDKGRIVERGSHAQLLEKNGHYARLFNSQFAVQ